MNKYFAIELLFTHKSNRLYIQFIRYLFAGSIAYVFDFLLLLSITEILTIHYLVSAAIAFLIGLTINYALCITWVFASRSFSSNSLEFGIFSLIGIIGLLINEVFIWFLTDIFAFHYLLSKLCATVFVLIWNFSARRYVLFRTSKPADT